MATGETGRGGGGDGEASSSSLANPQRIPLRKSVSSLGIGSERVKYFDESLKAWYDRLPYQRSPGQNVRAAVNERLRSHQPGNGVLTDLSQEGRVPLKLFSNSIFLDDSNLRAKGGQGRGDGNGTNSEVPIRHPSGTEEDSDVEGLKVKLQKVEKQSLVEIVVKHYAELVALGLVAEAKQLSAALDELTQAATRVSPDRTLTGVDQLLKNGLLDFLLKINPILPQTGSQTLYHGCPGHEHPDIPTPVPDLCLDGTRRPG
ncbi:hypothetical protein CBR_g3754 [Chara braunii]|uniref:Uncharacterized protein n=1 Tax=Chara braunii TaxID=69332 RepID=A0A388KGA7_CHABU|nr:hypothetical protein CBR_g3754 [Chara braunii]|eukprot:GBG69056.1 hypothetical protein CBR_g3754 [Chara braunii]